VLVARGLDIPFIVVTGTVSEEAAVECLKKGAADYLLKDRMARLGSAVTHALAERALRTEKRRTDETLRKRETDLKEAQRIAHVGSWEWNADSDTITWSEEYYRIYGRDPKQRPPGYKEHLQHYTSESAARLDAAVKKAQQTGQPYELDLEQARTDGTRRWVTARGEATRDARGRIDGLRGTAQDITERKQAEESRRARNRQHATELQLGQRALVGGDLTALMNEAAVLVADTLGVEYTEVLELLPDGQALLLRAGVGWKEGLVGHATVGAGVDLQTGYTLQSRDPVITEDLRSDARFHGPPLFCDHGVVSGMSVIIGAKDKPFGVLGAQTARRRQFTTDEVDFLQVIANVLGSAVERKQVECALVNSEARFRSLIANGSDLLGVFDVDGVIRYISPSIKPLTGYDVDEVLGRSYLEFIHPEDAQDAAADLAAIMQHRDELQVTEKRFRHKDGHWIRLETVAKNAVDDPAVGGIVINGRDVTEHRRAEEEIRVLATTDDLTGITNRREFTRLLENEIGRAARYGTGVALVMYDLDRFKRVNDTLGHVVGDDVLQEVTGVATKNIRTIDVVARWGGEEFMIMLPQSDLSAARTVAEKLRAAVADHRFGKVTTLTVSCGATAFVPGDDSNSLIKRVDDALYVAKARGRNRVECVDASTQSGSTGCR